MKDNTNSPHLKDFFFTVTGGHGRCHAIGIMGGCGVDCPAFQDGECDVPEEALGAVDKDGVDVTVEYLEALGYKLCWK